MVEPDSYRDAPFVLVTWQAVKQLSGIYLALQFNYLGSSKVGFCICGLKFQNGRSYQSAVLKEMFKSDAENIYEKVLHLASLGLGYAGALEDGGTEFEWELCKVPQRPLN